MNKPLKNSERRSHRNFQLLLNHKLRQRGWPEQPEPLTSTAALGSALPVGGHCFLLDCSFGFTVIASSTDGMGRSTTLIIKTMTGHLSNLLS